jgi:predicted TIM-barrel fold metal-dependent hydrolase
MMWPWTFLNWFCLCATADDPFGMEVAGLPPQRLLSYFPGLERLAHKVIYGSDWPGVPTIKENIEAIKSLDIGEDAKAKILGENAAKLLKITK